MKRRLFVFASALLLAAFPAFAQEGEGGVDVKVTTTLHNDGTRTDMQTDRGARTAESKTYDAAKRLIQRITYTLDDQGRLEEGVIYDVKGKDKDKVLSRVSYKYDVFGRLSDQFDKTANGTVLRRLVYRYDANNRLTGIDTYDSAGKLLQGSGSPAAGSSRNPGRSR